jgi:hypothetical protein
VDEPVHAMSLDPPIGVPRTYEDRVETLYPGETAWLEIGIQLAEVIAENTSAQAERPFRVAMQGTWHVEPTPGLGGWWRRTWFRVTTYIRQRAEADREARRRRRSE